MLKLLEQCNLTDRRGRNTLLLRLKLDLLQRVDFARLSVLRLVDDTVSSFADDFELLVSVDFLDRKSVV